MRLLILTQYYPPEIGAPQNRLHELAIRLKAYGVEVEVLTALPNYPKMKIQEGYEKGKKREEQIDGIAVHRAAIYVSASKSIVARLLNYFSFVWTSYWRGRKLDKFDFLLVESPPLFLGYSAMALSRKLSAKLIFNVSDLWPESAEKLGIVNNPYLLKMAYRLEAKCYQRAALVTGQTEGITADIAQRFPSTKVYWLPNGVNIDYYNPANLNESDFRTRNGFKASDLLFFYGGIIGHAQGLEVILHAAQQLLAFEHIHFILQGSGPEKAKLQELKAELQLTNIHFLEPVAKAEMPAVLQAIDVALVPLKNLPLFQGAIPSKVFEALAMEVPLLLGVDGEARRHFIEKAEAGWYFEPENAQALSACIIEIAKAPKIIQHAGKNGRAYVSQHFNRDQIAASLYKRLTSLS
ncbi:MAG: glycosyltransferase family 4 protein [Crocinitomicaceae bacterium]|nr:glycosyltransferase family 4 protein [Crocinitomicaceae bacterium]